MFSNKLVLVYTLISLVISQIIFWLVFLNFNQLPPQVPLWYLNSWGESMLVPVDLIWVLPGIAIASLGLDLLVSFFVYRHKPFLIDTIMVVNVFINLLVLIDTLNVLNSILGWY